MQKQIKSFGRAETTREIGKTTAGGRRRRRGGHFSKRSAEPCKGTQRPTVDLLLEQLEELDDRPVVHITRPVLADVEYRPAAPAYADVALCNGASGGTFHHVRREGGRPIMIGSWCSGSKPRH